MKRLYLIISIALSLFIFQPVINAQTSSIPSSSTSTQINANKDKISVAIMPFTYSEGMAVPSMVQTITELVASTFVESKRFIVIDRTSLDQVKVEKELQKTEDYLDSKIVEQNKSVGAQYVVTGQVGTATIRKQTEYYERGGSTDFYPCKISFTLKVINVETNEVLTSTLISSAAGEYVPIFGSLLSGTTSPEQSISQAIAKIRPTLALFLHDTFPVTINIASIESTDKKGAATSILIAAGSGMNIKKSDKLKVFEQTPFEISGKKIIRKKVIGSVRVDNVEDENFATCRVMTGGKEIAEKFSSGSLMVSTTLESDSSSREHYSSDNYAR